MPTINDIKPRAFRSVPIRFYTELKKEDLIQLHGLGLKANIKVEWFKGVPYRVETI